MRPRTEAEVSMDEMFEKGVKWLERAASYINWVEPGSTQPTQHSQTMAHTYSTMATAAFLACQVHDDRLRDRTVARARR